MMLEFKELIKYYTPWQVDRSVALHQAMHAVRYFGEHQGSALSCVDEKGEEQILVVTPRMIDIAKKAAFSFYQDLCLTGESGAGLAKGIMEHYNKKNKQEPPA